MSEPLRKSLWGKNSGKTIRELAIDTQALRALGCRYILSSVPIENAVQLGLESCGSMGREKGYWEIRIYRL